MKILTLTLVITFLILTSKAEEISSVLYSHEPLQIPLFYPSNHAKCYKKSFASIKIISFKADGHLIKPYSLGVNYDDMDFTEINSENNFIYTLPANLVYPIRKKGYWQFFTTNTPLPRWSGEIYEIPDTTKKINITYKVFLPNLTVSDTFTTNILMIDSVP